MIMIYFEPLETMMNLKAMQKSPVTMTREITRYIIVDVRCHMCDGNYPRSMF